MAAVLGLMGGLWGLGVLLGASLQARLALAGLVWGATVLAHLLLPAGAGLRAATGGSAAAWLVLGGAAVLILAYREGLRRLRARAAAGAAAAAAPAPAAAAAFREAELDRYARHIMLREIGGPGQRRLKAARVLVVGAGGLGSPVLLYLAAAGVGTLTVVDDDVVENANLQRQIIHADDRIGMAKVDSAAAAVAALNPFVTLQPLRMRLEADNVAALVDAHDLVLDGSDNFATRYLVNRACAAAGRPLIAAAMTQWEGQISLYHPAAGAPCYECVFPRAPAPGLVPACAVAGIVAPLPGVVGSLMALEAVKLLTGAGRTLAGRMLLFDALEAEWREVAVAPRAGCAACGGGRG
ncbi:MAG: molybdopterin-synthase adenylyltransferase MoeB [Rhodobacteraceae bacterium]|nr:molybdopterin-synthase adenylyltransferase MoeB [Paracoccaceae bacterium]